MIILIINKLTVLSHSRVPTDLFQHDLNAVLVRGALLAELPTAEVVEVPDGHHAGLRVAHQANVTRQCGVRSCGGSSSSYSCPPPSMSSIERMYC